MTPIKYTIKDGITTFHYDQEKLKNHTGGLATSREGNIFTYDYFKEGVIISGYTLVMNDIFGERIPTNDEMLIPYKERNPD